MYNGIKAAIVSLSLNRYLLQRMRKCMSDCCSARKRAGRDKFFALLGYDRLVFCHSGATEEEVAGKSFQVDVVKNVLGTIPESAVGEVDCGWFRTAPVNCYRAGQTVQYLRLRKKKKRVII